jgi:hypothetical protein
MTPGNVVQSVVEGKEPPLPFRNTHSVALVRELTIPTERPMFVGEVSANF